MKEHWPQYGKAGPDGPWDGPVGQVIQDGRLPSNAEGILNLAKEYQWGFGPITMVMRLNHPNREIPAFFMRWDYALDASKWSFAGARARNGQKLNYRDVRTVIQHPDALLPEDPDA